MFSGRRSMGKIIPIAARQCGSCSWPEIDCMVRFWSGIDDVIAFAEGPAAGIMGADAAAGMLAAAKARKADGWKYCICEAHTAAAELLGKFGRIEL